MRGRSGSGLGFLIYLAVFVVGAASLTIEISAARFIAPFYGVGLFVWTSVICVTLVGLAVGYWLGGLISVKYPNPSYLFLAIAVAGLFMFVPPAFGSQILPLFYNLGLRLGALCSATVLIFIPVVLIGSVAPCAIRLLTPVVEKSGVAGGRVYAISTIGSSAGILIAGFLLIPSIGLQTLFIAMGLVLVGLGVIGLLFAKRFMPVMILAILLLLIFGSDIFKIESFPVSITPYARILYKCDGLMGQIKVVEDGPNRILFVDGAAQSAINYKTKRPLFHSTRCLMITPLLLRNSRSALVIGLGAGTLCEEFVKMGLEVVSCEIDPRIVKVAEEFFDLDLSKVKVIKQDARIFLKKASKGAFDIVIFDAYIAEKDAYHLFSLEALRDIKRALSEEGIFAINYHGFTKGKRARSTCAVFNTLCRVWENVIIYGTNKNEEDRNLIFFACDDTIKINKEMANKPPEYCHKPLNMMLENKITLDKGITGPVLTDNYNPLDVLSEDAYMNVRINTVKKVNKDVLLK